VIPLSVHLGRTLTVGIASFVPVHFPSLVSLFSFMEQLIPNPKFLSTRGSCAGCEYRASCPPPRIAAIFFLGSFLCHSVILIGTLTFTHCLRSSHLQTTRASNYLKGLPSVFFPCHVQWRPGMIRRIHPFYSSAPQCRSICTIGWGFFFSSPESQPLGILSRLRCWDQNVVGLWPSLRVLYPDRSDLSCLFFPKSAVPDIPTSGLFSPLKIGSKT